MNRKLVVVLEGLDGSGKSSAATLLGAHLHDAGVPTRVLKVFDATDEGKAAAAWLKAHPDLDADETFKTCMRALVALQALVEAWFRETDGNAVAILDRWWPSGVAYQGTEGLPVEEILLRVADNITLTMYPALSFYLAASAETRRRRIEGRDNVTLSHLDRRSLKRHVPMDRMYRKLVRHGWLRLLNANGDLDWTVDRIYAAVWVALNGPTLPESMNVRRTIKQWLELVS